jgi:four helix bundle protein
MDYVMEIYRLTRDFPDYEKYGLGSQLQRSAVSIPSISRRFWRQHRKEFIQFLYLARGSLLESLTQLAIANRLDYINDSCLESIEASAQRST